MNLGLTGKTVLVAAASQGLGKAIADQFRAEGATVYTCSRHEDIQCDLTDPAQIKALFAKTGPVDILITNAGGPKPGTFTQISDQDWHDVFTLTFLSMVRLIREALPHMQQQHWGRIICLTSTSVKQPIQNLTTSNAMRAAVANLAKSLANEVGKDGVTVNVVAPGMFETARIQQLYPTPAERVHVQSTIPAQRFGQVEELAAAVAFLASEQASYINGCLLPVDGGLTKSL